MNILFVTWDGPGTTYHETLFVPLLARARGDGDHVHLLQFTWGSAARTARLLSLAAGLDMGFSTVSVPHRFASLAAPAMIGVGSIVVARAVARLDIDLVLARSIIPAGMALLARRAPGGRFAFIYDADGLAADEQAEYGGWTDRDLRYRAYRRIERAAVRRADAVLVRTHRASAILGERSGTPQERFTVVVNGKDENVYEPGSHADRARDRRLLGIPHEAPVIAYVGSVGPQYRAADMVETFRAVHARRADARLLCLTGEANHPQLRSLCADLPAGQVIIRQADPSEVPGYLALADLGLAYRTPTLSQQAVAPIKVAEYLLCGVPLVYTSGVGDLDDQLHGAAACAVGEGAAGAEWAASWLLEEVMPHRDNLRERCRRLGVEAFSLNKGAEGYRSALRAAAERHQQTGGPRA